MFGGVAFVKLDQAVMTGSCRQHLVDCASRSRPDFATGFAVITGPLVYGYCTLIKSRAVAPHVRSGRHMTHTLIMMPRCYCRQHWEVLLYRAGTPLGWKSCSSGCPAAIPKDVRKIASILDLPLLFVPAFKIACRAPEARDETGRVYAGAGSAVPQAAQRRSAPGSTREGAALRLGLPEMCLLHRSSSRCLTHCISSRRGGLRQCGGACW